MTARGQICRLCDRVIRGEGKTIPVDSASAARPDQHTHVADDPACKRITQAERERGY
ncbi:hypothetical protein ACFWP3_26380 [Streptomyces sp. NPDC058525]|uniref:hypothetical protein n=1 Tax=Streptomyces sp. NPDC058525 TaxID=3346538 RepID=UPI0036524E1E